MFILVLSTFTYYRIANAKELELSTIYPEPVKIVFGIASTETIITFKETTKEQMQKPEPTPTIQKVKTPARKVKKEVLAYNGSCYDYVDEMAGKYGVDGDLMRRIIKAESGGNANAKNRNSTASGCGQFIKSTWESTLRQMGREYILPFDVRTNVEAMAFKISRGGIGAWNASKSKWNK